MDADINLQNQDDKPLHLTVRSEMEYFVKILLHYSADIRNKNDETVVNFARNNRYPHVKILLKDDEAHSKGN